MGLPGFPRLNLSYQSLDSIVVCRESFSTLMNEGSIEDKHLIQWAQFTLWRYRLLSMEYNANSNGGLRQDT